MRRPVAAALLAAYLTVLFGLTLGGFYQPDPPWNLMPLRSIGHDLRAGGRHLAVNLLGNLAAFLPMGVLVPSMTGGRRPAPRVALASFGLSLLIEAIQGASGRRVADVDDVILNTAGGMIGLGLRRAHRSIGAGRWGFGSVMTRASSGSDRRGGGCRPEPGLEEWGNLSGVPVVAPPSNPGSARGRS